MKKKSIFSSGVAMKGKLGYLAITFVIWLILTPFQETRTGNILLNLLFTAILFFAVYAVAQSRKHLYIALFLGVPWFILNLRDKFAKTTPWSLELIGWILYIFFFAFIAIVIFQFVLKSVEVSKDVLYGAVCVYILIGGIWFAIYILLDKLQPGSFYATSTVNAGGVLDWPDFLYYSFATLTTLGYGDIIPVTSHARSFAILESIIGVMYLAIIISRLVGLYITQSKKD